MPLAVTSEKRKYTRYSHTVEESRYLKNKGLRAVISSNVSAVGLRNGELIIRFHGGATYAYPKSGDLYDDLVSAASKGKFVWKQLRKKNVPYYRVGNINIKDDIEDKDMMKPAEGTDMLKAIALSLVVDSDYAISKGIIAGLAYATLINANAENENSRQA